ncbi:MAG TPA: co-chaperone DjlA [Woeseiaceae bacterium]|nr:co-chaperone DjlA [Woeseiaceae bacterium]
MFLFLVAAALGYAIGGFRGLIIGVALAYGVSWLLQRVVQGGLGQIQSQFLESTFAAMGALCKADGTVTRDEIKVAEALFARLHLSAEQREAAKAAFNRGKSPGFDLDAEIAKLRQVSRGRGPLLQIFLQVQLTAIAADGGVHPAEHEMLVRMARGLGLSEADVAQLEAMLRTGTGTGARPTRQKLDDAYAALGVSPSASDAEIKRKYRRLMSQNHPDKLAGKGLPESMREVAEERTREISTAYRLIREARQSA